MGCVTTDELGQSVNERTIFTVDSSIFKPIRVGKCYVEYRNTSSSFSNLLAIADKLKVHQIPK
jgi:hypothetical protein